MHDNGLAHRDLKPANILVYKPGPNWWVKIGDFGISKRAEEENTALRTLIGTEGYLAPEIISFTFTHDPLKPDAFSYTFAVDMWALGELMFRMVAQRPAFPNRQDLFNCVVCGYPFPKKVLGTVGASSDCCDFILKSMIADPEKRLTAHETSLHSWLQISGPSSRASSATSKWNSEVATNLASIPPNLQAESETPLDGTAQWSTTSQEHQSPETAIYFGNTAGWSTGMQKPQEHQSSEPAIFFDNTAEWSTGIQQPQNPHLMSSSDNTARQSGGLPVDHNSQLTISFENTAQSSTRFQVPANPQVVEESTRPGSRRDHSGIADQTLKPSSPPPLQQIEEEHIQKESLGWQELQAEWDRLLGSPESQESSYAQQPKADLSVDRVAREVVLDQKPKPIRRRRPTVRDERPDNQLEGQEPPHAQYPVVKRPRAPVAKLGPQLTRPEERSDNQLEGQEIPPVPYPKVRRCRSVKPKERSDNQLEVRKIRAFQAAKAMTSRPVVSTSFGQYYEVARPEKSDNQLEG